MKEKQKELAKSWQRLSSILATLSSGLFVFSGLFATFWRGTTSTALDAQGLILRAREANLSSNLTTNITSSYSSVADKSVEVSTISLEGLEVGVASAGLLAGVSVIAWIFGHQKLKKA